MTLAARYGETEVCQLLLENKANVNNQTKEGETPLMWAAHGGHSKTCKYLLECEADINLQDKYGFTALIRAAKGGHEDACTILLEEGADVFATSELGDEVWDAECWARAYKYSRIEKLMKSRKVLCSLLKEGSDPPSHVTLNACGAVNAGKTTLIAKLQLSPVRRRLARRDEPDTSQDMSSRTAGIEVGIIDVPGVGEFRKMDMAGHTWAFTSNEYFIGKRTSISLVLFDLSKTDEEIEKDLFHHLSSLKARETKVGVLRFRPEVVLVATHVDKIEKGTDPRLRANAFFRMTKECFQAYLNFYSKVMVLDCTNPNAHDFDSLRVCLKELRAKIIENSDLVPRLCAQLLPRIRAWAKERPSFPVMSWKEFFEKVREINNTADEEGVRNIAFYLNESVEIVSDTSPELRDQIVLDVNWLTAHIFGIALAPSNFPRSLRGDIAHGMVGKRELQETFRECPFEQLIKLFVRFEVCLPWDEENLICENYLFPSHLEEDRIKSAELWPTKLDDRCVVGRIVECKNKTDALPNSFFSKFQIRLLRCFGHKSPVWNRGIKIADDTVEILASLSSTLTAVNVCVWAPKGCEERCYDSMRYIEGLRDDLLDEVAGGIEFVHKAMSIEVLKHRDFEGYPLTEVDEALEKGGPNARVKLSQEKYAVNERAIDVRYCGIRRYVHPFDHISHFPVRERKALSKILDSKIESDHLQLLSDRLKVPVEHEDSESGFTSVIPGSKTDRYLSRCAFERDLRADDLIQALEAANQFEAATIVSQWFANAKRSQEIRTMYRTRGESSDSVQSCSFASRSHGTSGVSEYSEVRTVSMGGGSVSEGSPLLRSSPRVSWISRRHISVSSDGKESGASESSLPFDVERERCDSGLSSSGGSFSGGNWRPRLKSESSSSGLSFPSEGSFFSCEESHTGSTEQIVPGPRLVVHPCSKCHYCTPKLPARDNEGTKPPLGIEETSQDTGASGPQKDSDRDVSLSSVQVSNGMSEEEAAEKESTPTCETAGEPELGESFPSIRRLIPELSTRLSVSWRPVAVDLGLRRRYLRRFEDSSLLRVQAEQMLHFLLATNRCTLECEQCQEVIFQRLSEAFENAYRADLVDFLQYSKEHLESAEV